MKNCGFPGPKTGFREPSNEICLLYTSNFEVSYAQAVLARCGGNLSAAAREAGVDRKTFYTLLRREKEQYPGESIPQMEQETGE